MSASADLNALLNAQNNLRYYQQQLLVITSKYDANLATLNDYQKYEEKWNDAETNCLGMDKEYKVGSKVFVKKSGSGSDVTYKVNGFKTIDEAAKAYATAKVKHDFSSVNTPDSEILEQLTNKDVEYDSLKTTFQAMCDQYQAEVDAGKENTSTECQKTHLLGGS